MQPQSDKKLYAERLDRLYIKRGVTWEEIAADIGVGVAMLMMVRTGKRGLSAKSLYRLEEAERAAGIEVRQSLPPPLFNPANDPQIAQRAADILGALERDTVTLPAEQRDRINGHFLQLMLLMTERAAAPAQAYMERLATAVQKDKAREAKRKKGERPEQD